MVYKMEQNGGTAVAAMTTTKDQISDFLRLCVVVSGRRLFPLRNFLRFLYSFCALQFFLPHFSLILLFLSHFIPLVSDSFLPFGVGNNIYLFMQFFHSFFCYFLSFLLCYPFRSLWCALCIYVQRESFAPNLPLAIDLLRDPFTEQCSKAMRKFQIRNLQQSLLADAASLHIYACVEIYIVF